MALSGLGDCGTSPCGVLDYFSASTACTNYNTCLTAQAAVAQANIPFSAMTAAQQAAFLDSMPAQASAADLAAQAAGAAPGMAFSDMTAAQQAAFTAALGIGSDTPSTTDTSSLDTVAMYLGIGLFGIIVLSHLLEGGR